MVQKLQFRQMALKNYSKLFTGARKQPKKPSSTGSAQKRNEDKLISERLIESIRGKIKDPELAKKAALIIEQMIQQEKK